ncbi:MAG: prolipoprotein diacylglyceryl transferase [Chloroflexi bacterium]|nr:prolipoprotein diacylglyceryl transferase [Chloroflexota bacterium]
MLEIFQTLFSPPRHMILLVIAAWLGLTFSEKRAEKHGITKDDLNNVSFYGLLAFVIGGRITYALQNLPAFTKSPLGIFSINPDLFDPFGGLAIAFISALIYGQRRQLRFWDMLDALTPFFTVLTIGSGLSHLAAGSAYGKPTDLPWGMELWNEVRHPTQIYEVIASLLVLGLLWRIKRIPHSGILFLTFAALTAFSQLIILAFRGDSTLILNGVRQEQLIAWVVLAAAFVLIEARFASPKPQETAPHKAN